MSGVPEDHPRRESLEARERLVEGWREGIVSTHGLIAHGRGEAFDYLFGEETLAPAEVAIEAAGAALFNTDSVISVNGNSAALAPEGLVELSEASGAPLEVNLFHREEERVERIAEHLESHGADGVLGVEPDAEVPGLSHDRGLVSSEGIGSAETVLVPLEDGDRTEALVAEGKRVVAIDLNPLSRTARGASVTVVDELTRCLPKIKNAGRDMEEGDARAVLDSFDNERNLSRTVELASERLKRLAEQD